MNKKYNFLFDITGNFNNDIGFTTTKVINCDTMKEALKIAFSIIKKETITKYGPIQHMTAKHCTIIKEFETVMIDTTIKICKMTDEMKTEIENCNCEQYCV